MNATGETGVRNNFTDSFNGLLKKLRLNYTEFAELLGEVSGEDIPRNRVRLWALGINIPEYDKLFLIGEEFGLDFNRLFYGEGEYWSPSIRRVQAEMREWAESMPAEMTPAQRIVAAWEKFHELYPHMPELVWAGYLQWLHFPRGSTENRVVMVYWLQCKFHTASIADAQIKGASDVTGIPASWFEGGHANTNSPQ